METLLEAGNLAATSGGLQPFKMIVVKNEEMRSKLVEISCGHAQVAEASHLNPAERYFEEIRRDSANQVFETLEKCEETITTSINKWTKDGLKQLLGYQWIMDQVGHG